MPPQSTHKHLGKQECNCTFNHQIQIGP